MLFSAENGWKQCKYLIIGEQISTKWYSTIWWYDYIPWFLSIINDVRNAFSGRIWWNMNVEEKN